jgi:hypothetical protein
MVKLLLSSLVVLGIVLGGGYTLYRHGYKVGFQDVQAEWRQREALLVKRVAELEAQHTEKQKEVAHEAEILRKEHVADVASQRIVYEQRLSQSDRRAQVYRTQANACDASTRNLATHAANLDRSLEEGRGLVRELGSHLRFCENRVRLLGEVIKADRELMQERMQ